MSREIHYAHSDGCTSPDDKHDLVDTDPPFFARCTICKERFYLISESAMERADIIIVARPLNTRVN